MILNVKATNKNGDSFDFDMSNRIVDGFDISGLTASVNSIDSSLGGSRYQNTRLNNRELSLNVQLRKGFNTEETMDLLRQRMYTVFSPELGPIRFDFKTNNGEEYYLDAYPVSAPIMPPNKVSYNAAYQSMLLQLRATDPYIYQKASSRTDIASYLGGFEFDLEIPEIGKEFERKSDDLFGIVEYNGNGESGMIIRMLASGAVSRPSIVNVNTLERISLNLDMLIGDVIEINTNRGQRSITLLRNNVRSNIFYTFNLTESTFLQLVPGNNVFRAAAENGENFLELAVEYRNRKIGV